MQGIAIEYIMVWLKRAEDTLVNAVNFRAFLRFELVCSKTGTMISAPVGYIMELDNPAMRIRALFVVITW
ncbi:hypothetical protein T265_03730 [Opisthorchis viverrini]|uniref:Uncharacterized protein n=1 Tax=Opisthorchis viverrini TaxID=6198 RepID=A0A074ZQP5_OPIVI|nr:hypothetical protein T265_03730 [Opisthorchis viverrini]KER29713.1 hypothetical protein T265_03730 [Opisthorchis viverrini]